MPPATYPLAQRLRRSYTPLACVAWVVVTVLGAAYYIHLFEAKNLEWERMQVHQIDNAIDTARKAALQERCGGPEAFRALLDNGDVQCYTKQGRRTLALKRKDLE